MDKITKITAVDGHKSIELTTVLIPIYYTESGWSVVGGGRPAHEPHLRIEFVCWPSIEGPTRLLTLNQAKQHRDGLSELIDEMEKHKS